MVISTFQFEKKAPKIGEETQYPIIIRYVLYKHARVVQIIRDCYYTSPYQHQRVIFIGENRETFSRTRHQRRLFVNFLPLVLPRRSTHHR